MLISSSAFFSAPVSLLLDLQQPPSQDINPQFCGSIVANENIVLTIFERSFGELNQNGDIRFNAQLINIEVCCWKVL